MKKNIRTVALMLAVSALLMTGGCANSGKRESAALFDLGPLIVQQTAQQTSQQTAASTQSTAPALSALPALPPITVADVHASTWLESPLMFYRLNYANDQQPHAYATSRWATPPMLLFTQRLKSRIAQAGGIALSGSDGAANVPTLRIDADDFTQSFSSPTQSGAQIVMRASVFNGHDLLAQKSFSRQAPAPSVDAAGGVKALTAASDDIISDMMMWLAGLPLKK